MDQKLTEFLTRARTPSWLGGRAKIVTVDGIDANKYHEGDLSYVELVFGGGALLGSEIVRDGKWPIWGRNSYGRVIVDDIDTVDVYCFLREAIWAITKADLSLRGLGEFSRGRWRYTAVFTADLGHGLFAAFEEIFRDGQCVYIGTYHGGPIWI